MTTVYEIRRERSISNDFLFVGPAVNNPTIFVATVLYDGERTEPFVSTDSEEAVRGLAERWVRENLDLKAEISLRRKA